MQAAGQAWGTEAGPDPCLSPGCRGRAQRVGNSLTDRGWRELGAGRGLPVSAHPRPPPHAPKPPVGASSAASGRLVRPSVPPWSQAWPRRMTECRRRDRLTGRQRTPGASLAPPGPCHSSAETQPRFAHSPAGALVFLSSVQRHQESRNAQVRAPLSWANPRSRVPRPRGNSVSNLIRDRPLCSEGLVPVCSLTSGLRESQVPPKCPWCGQAFPHSLRWPCPVTLATWPSLSRGHTGRLCVCASACKHPHACAWGPGCDRWTTTCFSVPSVFLVPAQRPAGCHRTEGPALPGCVRHRVQRGGTWGQGGASWDPEEPPALDRGCPLGGRLLRLSPGLHESPGG